MIAHIVHFIVSFLCYRRLFVIVIFRLLSPGILDKIASYYHVLMR